MEKNIKGQIEGDAPGGPVPRGGPRIVINPTTFRNEKDALCVAFNEAFRVVMEEMQFDPVSEPTERQRKFFSDTAYADDENQLRRTILARICTFDTSVKDPTDEQLQEAVEFLEYVMESGAPQNEWEQSAVQRIRDVVEKSVGAKRAEEPKPEPPEDEGAVEADVGGGETEESEGTPGTQPQEGSAVDEETGLPADIAADLVGENAAPDRWTPELPEFDRELTAQLNRQEAMRTSPTFYADGGKRIGTRGFRMPAEPAEPAEPAARRTGLTVQNGPAGSPAEGVRAHNSKYKPGSMVQDGPARSPAEGVRAHAKWFEEQRRKGLIPGGLL